MRIILHTFTIWVLTALINAVVSASLLAFSDSEFNRWVFAFSLAFFFTLIFSAPAVFIFFIFFATTENDDAGYLFRVLVITGFVTATISAAVFYAAFNSIFKSFTILLTLSIVCSTLSAIMLHHKFIVATCKSHLPP
ncbi:hypothetical protein QWZ08_25205 [Ferruginibacter paludis]|uniref:hypothetical protein n=1 Tax=Ferruginibacter paludis TaxID=1310417 RepID=UPI0025B421CA|nr:hypothetical protein [Ferruginibacter paludis]MDN3658966.1 hypothetical protein [Ferruginibacter paludis]